MGISKIGGYQALPSGVFGGLTLYRIECICVCLIAGGRGCIGARLIFINLHSIKSNIKEKRGQGWLSRPCSGGHSLWNCVGKYIWCCSDAGAISDRCWACGGDHDWDHRNAWVQFKCDQNDRLRVLCSFGALLIKKFKIPSATLLSGMLISGTFYTFEIIDARFPDIFINIAFVFLGTALGSRLNGLKLNELGKYLFHGIIMSILLIFLSALFSYLLSFIDGFEFLPTFLSFTPGGIHEMIIISVAYDIDPIFVSYHHFLRIILIVLLIPFIIKKFNHNE